MPLGSRSRSRTKCPLYPLLSCQSSSVAPQMPHEFGYWFSVRSPVSASQRHFPLAPGCLPGLRGGADGGVHGLAAAEPLTSSFWPPSPLDGSPPKGLSDDGGFEEFVEFLASRSASSTVIACNRHRSSRRAPELSPSKKARFIAERLTGGLFDMPAKESDSRLPRQHFSPETAQSSQYTAPPRIRDCERFREHKGCDANECDDAHAVLQGENNRIVVDLTAVGHHQHTAYPIHENGTNEPENLGMTVQRTPGIRGYIAVSYTHLTLPTNREV